MYDSSFVIVVSLKVLFRSMCLSFGKENVSVALSLAQKGL